MPVIGLGVYQNPSCKPACLAALQCGYRHIDSARSYRNEAQVGDAVRESGVSRGDVFITSKINKTVGGYRSCLDAIDDSLKKFGFDYLDLFLIHSPYGGKAVRLDAWKALLAAKKAGKLRSVGVSNYNVKHIEELVEEGLELPSVNQIELHPYCQQRPIVDYCRSRGIVVQAYSPLVRGEFGNPVLQEISTKDPAQILIHSSPLPKTQNPDRVRSNIDVFSFEMSKEDIEKLDELDRGKEGAVTWNPVDAD
ncbi:NADP-dependent oxidoreductase domain-containing protein [Russula earlei]|uniref:NADP-dependent oxidoreductase domain-containing protein n=1 Tax=Russula earlei TaxID=71964 RepID=A0ACC0UNW0_9AGAM|nr:NADP-dependent oxidoreductase domain-containing protein [Russula earlei]